MLKEKRLKKRSGKKDKESTVALGNSNVSTAIPNTSVNVTAPNTNSLKKKKATGLALKKGTG